MRTAIIQAVLATRGAKVVGDQATGAQFFYHQFSHFYQGHRRRRHIKNTFACQLKSYALSASLILGIAFFTFS